MVEVKTQYPFVEDNGELRYDIERHWAEDTETGDKYTIIQDQTGYEYGEAIDGYPCIYTYSVGNIIKEETEE